MNSKYFILFILGRPDEFYQEIVNILIFLLILGHFQSTVQWTVSIFFKFIKFSFFLLDRFVFMDEFDCIEGVGKETESEIEPVSWPV